MDNVQCLDGKDYFEESTIPVAVMTAEHRSASKHYHTHLFYEFVYIEQGFSTHYFNKTTMLLTPGDVFGMRPGDVHGYTYPKDTVLFNCIFNASAIKNEMEQLKKLPGIGPIFAESKPSVWQRIHLDPIKRKQAHDCLHDMMLERKEKASGWELRMKNLLLDFLVIFSRSFIKNDGGKDPGGYTYVKYMYKALSVIEKNFQDPISIDDIAEAAGLSTDYFSRMFKQFTGLTPMEYIKNVRLAKAVDLLLMPSVSVAEAAQRVGFEDPGYFARQFKNSLGISPSRYKRENSI
jgi:AraC-like DNA-binding protein/mannose-6-phosphate isomerase-like protein (cupin superfamily)